LTQPTLEELAAKIPPEARCGIVLGVAMEALTSHCTDPRLLAKMFAGYLGVDETIDCSTVPEEPGKETCSNTRKLREWVLCKASKLFEQMKRGTFGDNVKAAWIVARDLCKEAGIEI
jgi:hypothetical protein